MTQVTRILLYSPYVSRYLPTGGFLSVGFQAHLCPQCRAAAHPGISSVDRRKWSFYLDKERIYHKTIRMSPLMPFFLIEESLHLKSGFPSDGFTLCIGSSWVAAPFVYAVVAGSGGLCKDQKWLNSCGPGRFFFSFLSLRFLSHLLSYFYQCPVFITAALFTSSLTLSSCIKESLIHSISRTKFSSCP